MKYVLKRERLSLSGAMKYLYEGYFIRRSGWTHGVIFTKVDYRRTMFSEAVFSEYDNIESLLKENPVLVPQFWYAIGTIRYKNTPEDAYAKDWQVVQCLSMTAKEEERVSGKLGGVKLVEIQ